MIGDSVWQSKMAMKIHTIYQPYRKKPCVARWYDKWQMCHRFFATEKSRDVQRTVVGLKG